MTTGTTVVDSSKSLKILFDNRCWSISIEIRLYNSFAEFEVGDLIIILAKRRVCFSSILKVTLVNLKRTKSHATVTDHPSSSPRRLNLMKGIEEPVIGGMGMKGDSNSNRNQQVFHVHCGDSLQKLSTRVNIKRCLWSRLHIYTKRRTYDHRKIIQTNKGRISESGK